MGPAPPKAIPRLPRAGIPGTVTLPVSDFTKPIAEDSTIDLPAVFIACTDPYTQGHKSLFISTWVPPQLDPKLLEAYGP